MLPSCYVTRGFARPGGFRAQCPLEHSPWPPACGPEAREVDDFPRRPPIPTLLVPAREPLWRLPPKHILRAMARLGPDTRPAPYTLQDGTAILDGPGRAQRGDGGDSGRWRTPG
ncbi:hypothetical protein ACWC0A_26300 [Streptomyces scopuliridis]